MCKFPPEGRTTNLGRSKLDFESSVASAGLDLYFVNSNHVAVRRSVFERFTEVDERRHRAFGDRLDRSIWKIPDCPADSRLSRGSNREIAKPYALNSSPNYESPSYRHWLKPPRLKS